MPQVHSPLGASSAYRWMACPGSYRITQAITTPATTSRYAAEGTVAHQIAEEILLNGGPLDRFLGQVFRVDTHDITVTDDMVKAVEIYLDVVTPLIGRADWYRVENSIELTAYWPPDQLTVPLFGTADLLAYWRKHRRLTVADYKHGAGLYVSHIDNPQPYYYVAGGLVLCEALGYEVSEVEMIIVQPRVTGRPAVRSIVVPAIDVLVWVETKLKPAVAATQQPDAALVMGNHCRLCPGRVICPAMQKLRTDAAKRAFGPVAEDVADATDADLARYLDDIEHLETWIDAARQEARDRIDAGASIPGWGLVPTRPKRVWREESVVAQWLRAAGYRPDDIFEYALRSPAQMQKRVKQTDWRDLEYFVDAHSGGTKLARSVTPRPDPTSQFEATQESESP